jgi:ABC-type xylose transport system permease subunit
VTDWKHGSPIVWKGEYEGKEYEDKGEAGPVIAGVSLFGGRGNVWAALLGALVIGSISNGMDLMPWSRR